MFQGESVLNDGGLAVISANMCHIIWTSRGRSTVLSNESGVNSQRFDDSKIIIHCVVLTERANQSLSTKALLVMPWTNGPGLSIVAGFAWLLAAGVEFCSDCGSPMAVACSFLGEVKRRKTQMTS